MCSEILHNFSLDTKKCVTKCYYNASPWKLIKITSFLMFVYIKPVKVKTVVYYCVHCFFFRLYFCIYRKWPIKRPVLGVICHECPGCFQSPFKTRCIVEQGEGFCDQHWKKFCDFCEKFTRLILAVFIFILFNDRPSGTSAHPKAFILNKYPGCLIGHLRYFCHSNLL